MNVKKTFQSDSIVQVQQPAIETQSLTHQPHSESLSPPETMIEYKRSANLCLKKKKKIYIKIQSQTNVKSTDSKNIALSEKVLPSTEMPQSDRHFRHLAVKK